MFNDLNANNTNQDKSQVAVDDIFAETDKAPASPSAHIPSGLTNTHSSPGKSSEISAQKVGLATGNNPEQGSEDKNSQSWFKWILISIVVVIIALSSYLMYNRFFKSKTFNQLNSNLATSSVNNKQQTVVSKKQTVVSKKTVASSVKDNKSNDSFVTPSSDNNVKTGTTLATSSSNNVSAKIPAIPGVNSPTRFASTTSTSSVNQKFITPANLIDSDGDGLTDVQEKKYGTNPHLVDTDGDGLSDYAEVMIYHTNPLNPDTDGDGYSDGEEVKNGYNPLGSGKLKLISSTTSSSLGQ